MTTDEYSDVLEELLKSKMDSYALLVDILKALSTDDKIDIFLYIARMNDLTVPKKD